MKGIIIITLILLASSLESVSADRLQTYQQIHTNARDAARRYLKQDGIPLLSEIEQYAKELALLSYQPDRVSSLLRRVEERLGQDGDGVSSLCVSDLMMFVKGLSHQAPWALKMIDALAKPHAGIPQGNLIWLGAYDECLNTTAYDASGTQAFTGQYCLIHTRSRPGPPYQSQPIFRVGACVPSGCSVDDINVFLDMVNKMIPHKNTSETMEAALSPASPHPTGVAAATTQLPLDFSPPSMAHISFSADCRHPDPPLDTKAIVAIVVVGLIVGLVALGTCFDVALVWQKTEKRQVPMRPPKGTINGDAEDTGATGDQAGENEPLLGNHTPGEEPGRRKPSTIERVLLAFSAFTNGSRVLHTGSQQEGTLPVIHGIRFFSMAWVILGHTYVFGVGTTGNILEVFNLGNRFTFQVVDNAYFSVDSFFVLSGLLLTFVTIRDWEKKGKVNWVKFYIHRFWRLTPVYMIVLMIEVCLVRFMGSGPMWPSDTGFEVDFCKNTWWTNLLYVNNFVDEEKQCFSWSWYLANDMQMFVISPLVLIPLHYSRVAGFVVAGAFVILHAAVNASLTYMHKLGVGDLTDSKLQDYQNSLYMKPYARVGPYMIGMLTGYLLHACKGRFKAHKGLIALGWLSATAIAMAAVYGLLGTYQGHEMSPAYSATYNAFGRLAWSLALCWLIFACSTGHGGPVNAFLSWRPLIVLSRLTYSAYLIHPIIMFFAYFTRRTPMYMTDVSAAYFYIGNLVFAYATAFCVSLCFEAPMMGLEKALWRRK